MIRLRTSRLARNRPDQHAVDRDPRDTAYPERVQRRRVGSSGLEVSRVGLGTMTWGETTNAEDAAAQLDAFVEAGGTLVETADGYGDGAAQQVLGGLIGPVVPRLARYMAWSACVISVRLSRPCSG